MIIQISFSTFARIFYGIQKKLFLNSTRRTVMKIIKLKHELKAEIESLKLSGKTIGFIPTMGALHNGHKSLVERCVAENDSCIVSIFVNPTQFNNSADLDKYPRNLNHDADFLESIGCQLIFAPEPQEIYQSNELNNRFEFDFGGLDTVMEGKFRPGHFNGVVQIVSKLFQLIQPDKAYFGEKDFQQLAIIHRMVKLLNFNIEIIDCPIVREPGGLALSSRNERLTEVQHKKAVEISKVLSESRNFAAQLSPIELTQWVVDLINLVPGLEVEYFEIVNTSTLQPVYSWTEPSVGCIAVYCGDVRLIDNIKYKAIDN
jgi:pantoate--beta-alanine ligase